MRLLGLVCGGLLLVAFFAQAATDPDTAQPTAQALLDGVVQRLPREPLFIAGELVLKRRKGMVEQRYAFDMYLHWDATPALARYTVRDALGGELEQLTITRAVGQPPRYAYAAGQPLQPAPPPDLSAPLRGTDLSWNDLTLAFLWWRGGKLAGADTVKERPCYMVDVPAPAGERNACARVRLWIDQEACMLLQAEGYTPAGAVQRRLWVKSFKKINDRWMIKDLVIEGSSDARRTELHIQDLEPAGPDGKPAPQGPAPAVETLPAAAPWPTTGQP